MSQKDIQELAKRYSGNVAKLLTLGRPVANPRKTLSYVEGLGINESDVPQLLQLADDMEIYHYEYGDVTDDEAKEFFGVIHAWKALSELGVPEAKALFQKLIMQFDDDLFDEWMLVEFRSLMVPFRASMFEESVRIIKDESINQWIRLEYLELVRDMLAHGEVSVSKVNALLADIFAASQSQVINAFAIGICTDHQLTEHYEAIAKCYENDLVDIEHLGDLEDVEIKFGIRTERSAPKKLTPEQEEFQEMLSAFEYEDVHSEPSLTPLVNRESKVGRNDPCPCGSGKKYKKCCMKK